VPVTGASTAVRIHMVNTGSLAVAHVNTPQGAVEYEGEARIDGVPGTAAPIALEFLDVAGASCGSLLPTGAVADRFEGKRFSRPNDVICHSNGTIMFTDPDFRVPLQEREIGNAAVYRVTPAGAVSEVTKVEYPNGLALSADERTLFIANTRWTQYIHAVELDSAGNAVRRRVFADMSADGDGLNGVPDGMKIDASGRVFCTGTGGVWVFGPDGSRIGIIETPEICANIAFGGPDLRTLLLTATTSVYALRVKVPGLPHPWYRLRK